VKLAKDAGAKVLVDAAQAVPHFAVDVQAIGCDFLVYSGHKLYGPTGIGVLYGKKDLLANMRPYQGGGDMIEQVKFSGTTFKGPPERFEAGTPNIAGAIGLAAAVEFLDVLGRERLLEHEEALLEYATEKLAQIEGLRIVGTAANKASVISFVMDCAHPHDIGSFLDADGIAVRTGHHCCQPLMQKLGLTGTARASFSFYNTFEEIDRLVESLHKIRKFFG
jgi:cysteine desulfurase/selenocysteine lyase